LTTKRAYVVGNHPNNSLEDLHRVETPGKGDQEDPEEAKSNQKHQPQPENNTTPLKKMRN